MSQLRLPKFLRGRRINYYYKCQDIIDYLHDRVAEDGFADDGACIREFGEAAYNAFLHELRLMGVADDIGERTPAMEWLYASNYFQNKSLSELRNIISFTLSLLAFAVSVLVALFK